MADEMNLEEAQQETIRAASEQEIAQAAEPLSLEEIAFGKAKTPYDAPLTAEELEGLTGEGGCAAHNLPANATRKEKMDACASCGESGCGEREIVFKDSPKKMLLSFIIAFVAVAALCLFMQYVVPGLQ